MNNLALESVKHSLALADQRGEPFVCATVHLRRDDLRAVLAEVERLRAELERVQNYATGPTWATHRESLVSVAERQRAACAGAAYTAMSLHPEPSPRSQFRAAVTDAIDATPLVTEGEP